MSSYSSAYSAETGQIHHHHHHQSPPQHYQHTHRRHSQVHHTTAPYSIPQQKLNNGVHQEQVSYSQSPHSTNGHIPSYKSSAAPAPAISNPMPPMQNEFSQSYPLLSREFVVRRISEGETGRLKEELKCEACGKGYKHISSLAKHLWEHTPEWNVTKKLLISKHQQVQLLEAASILCSMTEPPLTPKTSPTRVPSDSPVEFDNVDPSSTSNSSDSPSPFEQNGHTQYTPSSTNTSAMSSAQQNGEIKFRHDSISQYPPSSVQHSHQKAQPRVHQQQQQHPLSSPHDKSRTGGYIDIVTQAQTNEYPRKNSVTSPGTDENGAWHSNTYQSHSYLNSVPERDFEAYHHKNSVSTLNSENTIRVSRQPETTDRADGAKAEKTTEDETDGVFGSMD